MTVPQRVAMTLPHKLGVKETMDLAVWAEERGYDDVWFADNSGIDALTTSAAVAARISCSTYSRVKANSTYSWPMPWSS